MAATKLHLERKSKDADMKDISGELIYLLLFAVVVLGQYLVQWLRRNKEIRQDDAQMEPQQPAQSQATEELPAIQIPGPMQFVPHPLAELATCEDRSYPPAVPERALVRAPRRYSRAALLGNKRRTQEAVVAAAILGPCRAYLPHDNGQ